MFATTARALIAARSNAARLAILGGWPAWVDGEKSLVSRIPTDENTSAPGFDAGLACALGLIPEDKQWLAATLHAAYTEVAVEQVRYDAERGMDPDSETCWWLAACSICKEGGVDERAFHKQVETFLVLAGDPDARQAAARKELEAMKTRFRIVDGIPFVIQDGGLQGAYILGHDWGVQYMDAYGIFFIGTFRMSLGLERFPFSDRVDDQGRPMSGPVHGSQQFVKVSAFDELSAAVAVVRTHLGG